MFDVGALEEVAVFLRLHEPVLVHVDVDQRELVVIEHVVLTSKTVRTVKFEKANCLVDLQFPESSSELGLQFLGELQSPAEHFVGVVEETFTGPELVEPTLVRPFNSKVGAVYLVEDPKSLGKGCVSPAINFCRDFRILLHLGPVG